MESKVVDLTQVQNNEYSDVNVKNNTKPSTTCFVAFIRHGEKGNKVPGFKFKNKHDPPLTPLGIKQAR